MPSRANAADRGRERGRRLAELVRRELRDARIDRGLSQAAVGRPVGLSASEVSRIERGHVALDLERAAALLAIVGLDLAVRAYPGGNPLRDAGHATVIDRLRRRLHSTIRLRTEVSIRVDQLRAWDFVLDGRIGGRWSLPGEAETHPSDLQALERRLALKQQDAAEEALLLLLPDTRHNREIVRAARNALAARFPVPATRALAALAEGRHPGGSTLVLL